VYLWWRRNNSGRGRLDTLKKGTRHGDNLLADLKVEDGAGFRNFVRMTLADAEVSLQMIGCIILASPYSHLSTYEHLSWR
jgi:hypothetical protein